MPKYTRKEFSKFCWPNLDQSKGLAKLRVYISRGKVVEKNKLIDSANQVNAQFAKREQDLEADGGSIRNNHSKTEKKKTKKRTEPVTIPPNYQDDDIDSNPDGEEEEDNEIDFSGRGDQMFTVAELNAGGTAYIEKAKKHVEVIRIQHDIELKQLQKQRLEGRVIPTDLVKEIFSQHFKNVTDEFYQAIDNLVTTMNARLGGTREDMVRMRAELKSEVNTAVHLAKVQTEKDIINMVETYSESISKK